MKNKPLVNSFLILSSIFASLLPITNANAATYVNISGQVTNSAGVPLQSPSRALAIVPTGQIVGNLDSQGKYSIDVPTGTPIEMFFVLCEDCSLISNTGITFEVNRVNPGSSTWKTKFTSLQEDRVIDFRLPQFVQLEVKVTDAQSHLMNNSVIVLNDVNQDHDPYISNGLTWTGIQYPVTSTARFVSRTGTFTFQFYPTSTFRGFNYWQASDLSDLTLTPLRLNSPSFSIVSGRSIQLCLPVNFGSIKSTPESCLDNQLAAAELKAKQEADAKAAAELKAKQEADAKAAEAIAIAQKLITARGAIVKVLRDKLTSQFRLKPDLKKEIIKLQGALEAINYSDATLPEIVFNAQTAVIEKQIATIEKLKVITCSKGKTVKKIQGVNPKCPAGYKVKK